MVAVKRKLTEKRLKSENSDTSDDNPFVKDDENASGDEIDEILSEQDDESDDEASESLETENHDKEISRGIIKDKDEDPNISNENSASSTES